MTPDCSNCKNFRPGIRKEGENILFLGQKHKHICTLTGKSALWERAVKLSKFSRDGDRRDGHHIYTPVTDNCGPTGQFFKGKKLHAVA